jgi:hypothetical protein
MSALRWVGFAAGIWVVLAMWVSVIGTLIVTRGVSSRIAYLSSRLVRILFVAVTSRARTYRTVDRVLAWQAGVALLVRLMVWLGLAVSGYGLILLPLVSGSAGNAFSEAGSSMFTLGFSPPAGSGSTVVDYVASFTGLIVIGLQVGYLPTLYSAFTRRETEVTLLIARAGIPAWGPEILARTTWGIYDGDSRPVLDELFTSWERWSAEVAESHTTYLTLVWMRSPRPLSHWLTALVAVMDSAALHLALSPDREPKLSARLCLRSGFLAINQIARAMGLPANDDADANQPISVTEGEFTEAVAMLENLNYPAQVDAATAWPHFRGWRANYDTAALALAYALDAPPALWSGPRRFTQSPMAPQRPANRTPRAAS